jgi:hypothetical protein
MGLKIFKGPNGYTKKVLLTQDRAMRIEQDTKYGQWLTYKNNGITGARIRVINSMRRVLQHKKRTLAWQISSDSQTTLL